MLKDLATVIVAISVIGATAKGLKKADPPSTPTSAEIAQVETPVAEAPVVEATPAQIAEKEVPRQVIPREEPREYSTDPVKNYAQKRVTETFGSSHWESFNQIVKNESGWNYRAINRSSGACGLFQANPCSKAGGDYRSNPYTQVEWGISYMKNRYGNPINAWAFWKSHRWY